MPTHQASAVQMPVPTGCLAHFDLAVYRPYMKSIVRLLADLETGWDGPGFLDDPPRYCLVRAGMPPRPTDKVASGRFLDRAS